MQGKLKKFSWLKSPLIFIIVAFAILFIVHRWITYPQRFLQQAVEANGGQFYFQTLFDHVMVVSFESRPKKFSDEALATILSRIRLADRPTFLRMRGFSLNPDYLRQIGACKQIVGVDFIYSRFPDGGTDSLAGLTDLTVLLLAITEASPEDLRFIRALKQLEAIDLTETNADDSTVADIGTLPHLVHVALNRCQISDDAVKQLCRIPGLRRIELGSSGITNDGISHLSCFKHLEYLRVAGSNVTAEGIAKLLRSTRVDEVLIAGLKSENISDLQKKFPKTRFE